MMHGLDKGGNGVRVVDFGGEEEDLVLMEEPEAYEDNDDGLMGSRRRMILDEEEDEVSKSNKKQLALIYSLHLAEAIVAASLQPQLYVLLRDSEHCKRIDAAYWSGLVEAILTLGSVAGLLWGKLGDRRGRRPLALWGLFGLSISCIAMGFSEGVFVCLLIRLFAGLMSSAIRVAMATMLGDISESSKSKVRNYSKLPIVASGGVIGPLLQAALAHRYGERAFWKRFPVLNSQLACAGLVAAVAVLNLIYLKETLPRSALDEEECYSSSSPSLRRDSESSSEEYVEKDTFLAQSSRAHHAPEPLPISQILKAPSLAVLLCSFSFLLLHSASFDQLLPLLGATPADQGGLNLPCSYTSIAAIFSSIIGGLIIAFSTAPAVQRLGLLRLYQITCWAFPVIYVATPLLFHLLPSGSIIPSAAISVFVKTLTTGFAETLVIVLVASSSPDPFSLASIMGVMQAVSILKMLALGGTGIAWSIAAVGDEAAGRERMELGLWMIMVIVGLGGAVGAYLVRERPTVVEFEERGGLRWEVCYDSMESERVDESGWGRYEG